MTLKLITPPEDEPISLADAKAHLRVEGTDEDSLIGLLITSARQAAEHETGRRLGAQTWELVLDAFPAVEVELRVPDVQSITSVVYVDQDGLAQTLSADAYVLDAEDQSGAAWLLPAAGYSWPAVADTANAVRVRFVCGSASVPASIRHWMLLHVGTGYRNREHQVQGVSVAELTGRYHAALLDPWRVYL